MREKREDLLFKRTLKIFLFVILPSLIIYFILNSHLTGFAVNSTSPTTAAMGIVGAFLGTIILFFMILLVILKIRGKPYKAKNSKP